MRKVPPGIQIMFGGADWSRRSTEVATLSSTHASHCWCSGRTKLVLGKDERQNSCDDRSGDGALNLIQIKDVSFKNACPIVGTTTPKVKPIGRRKSFLRSSFGPLGYFEA